MTFSPGWVQEGGGDYRKPTAIDALADIVVGLTDKAEVQALQQEGPKALSCSTFELKIDLTPEACVAISLGNFTGQSSPNATVGVEDSQISAQVTMALNGRHYSGIGQKLIFENRTIAVGVRFVNQPGTIRGLGDRGQQAAEVYLASFSQFDCSGP